MLSKTNMNTKLIQWVLRIAVAGEFTGHGMLAIGGKSDWVGWISNMTGANPDLAVRLLLYIGLLDLAVALAVLVKPIRIVLLWAVVWGFWTALVRPLVGQSVLDFVERSANWGAPLALLLMFSRPYSFKDWFK